MEHTIVLSKEALLDYLFHELNGAATHKVTIRLDENGCWIGQVAIEETDEPKEDYKYYMALAELMR